MPSKKTNNNELRMTVYRKPTHTDRLLDESSYIPTSHKATNIKTLTRQAQLVCDTPLLTYWSWRNEPEPDTYYYGDYTLH